MMHVNEYAVSRQFVAFPQQSFTKWAARVGKRSDKQRWTRFFAVVGTMMALMLTWTFLAPQLGPGFWSFMADHREFFYPIPFLAPVAALGLLGYIQWRNHRKILITVTGEGVTIDRRAGEVFSIVDAQLGPWAGYITGGMTVGTVLHLQSGRDQFLLGGRDHRVGNGIRLDAPPTDMVDAWMSGADFDQLLATAGRRSHMDPAGAAPAGPTRCLLFPNGEAMQQISPFAIRGRQRLGRAMMAGQPLLAIDVDRDAIRVVNPANNAVAASASPAQVTGIPQTYRYWMANWSSPVLVMSVPGLQPLTISCLDRSDPTPNYFSMRGPISGPKYSWRGQVQQVNNPAMYTVSGIDWLTLVEKCGLAPYLETYNQAG